MHLHAPLNEDNYTVDRYRQCIELGQESLPGPNRFQSLLRAQRLFQLEVP